MYREEQLLLGDLANSQLGHCDENDYCRVHLGYTFLFWSEMDAPLPSFYFFFLLPFFYFFSLSAMKYWYSTNGNQSTFYSQNSETVKGEKIVIVHSDLDTVGGSTKKMYFVTVNVRKESRYPVLNVHHWTQKKLEGEWHPLHPWLIFGL